MGSEEMTHEAASALLPWYANGTLDEDERSAVGRHLSKCRVCADELAEFRVIERAVRDENPVPLVPRPRFDELVARIDGQPGPRESRQRMLPVAAAASVAALLVAATAWFVVTGRPAGNEFETVTSQPTVGVVQYVFEIRFDDATTLADMRDLYAEFNAVDLGSESDPRVRRVIVARAPMSLDELDLLRSALEAHDGVVRASAVGVQIPAQAVR